MSYLGRNGAFRFTYQNMQRRYVESLFGQERIYVVRSIAHVGKLAERFRPQAVCFQQYQYDADLPQILAVRVVQNVPVGCFAQQYQINQDDEHFELDVLVCRAVAVCLE